MIIGEKVLVVATHPDDETLGCGGTLLRLRDEGNQLFWLIMTGISEDLNYPSKRIKQRRDEINKVKELYKFKKVFKFNYPTTRLDRAPMGELVQKISNIIQEVKPECIFIPNRSDIHSDHRITFEAALSCTKQFRFPFLHRVLMYETISETEFAAPFTDQAFVPNFYCNVTHFIEEKIKIAKIYQSEMGRHPFPRSEENIRALATFRGATINVDYAESFMILKEVML